MEHDSTLYVGLDVHKDSITVAYAIEMGEVELFGKIGTTHIDIDRLCKRLQSKAQHIPASLSLQCNAAAIPSRAARCRWSTSSGHTSCQSSGLRSHRITALSGQCGSSGFVSTQ
jgi:hypothetical protein